MSQDFAKWIFGHTRRTDRSVRWHLLEILNIYRLLLASAGLSISAAPPVAAALHIQYPLITATASLAYLIVGIGFTVGLVYETPGLEAQSRLEPLTDLAAALVLIEAAGGHLAALAMLLSLPVAVGAAVALRRTQAYFPAAVAALIMLASSLGQRLSGTGSVVDYTAGAMLGGALFALAWLAHFLAARLLASEALARRRGLDVQRLDILNRQIIAELNIGILVVDRNGVVLRRNPAVSRLLGDVGLIKLLSSLRELQHDNTDQEHLLELPGGAMRHVRLRPIDLRGDRLVLIEDATAAAAQAQALKLAALGRLSAAIAHQIRNPLAAITHASQLLAEQRTLDEQQHRLVSIMERQARRLEQIVEDVLRLSRRAPPDQQTFDLSKWLERFRLSYGESHPDRLTRLAIHAPSWQLPLRFDPGHLELILQNLVDNAFVHGDTSAPVELRAGQTESIVYLEVLNRGPGLSGREETMFEPFATTHAQGTGLGLYLARELATTNGARIGGASRRGGGACMRVEFQTAGGE